jgi:porphobilinogen synthase
MRRLVRENVLLPDDLICPLFVDEGAAGRIAVDSMPGIERVPLGDVAGEAGNIYDLGIPAVMLFGVPAKKDPAGSGAYDENGIVQRAISEIRKNCGNAVIMADVCLCQYTSSGHCGLLKDDTVDNDSSIEVLARTAVSQARAGVDVVSPSAMMDGQVAAIRTALDDAGFQNVAIMSHSAKQGSNFYSPFRDAAECAPKFGDRKTYQVPYSNSRESMREVEADIGEGVDIVMIKPALAYLDLIAEARRRFDVPVSAYSVSGEYALVAAAARNGWIDQDEITHEILCSIKRAGADMIVTYFARRAAAFLRDMR